MKTISFNEMPEALASIIEIQSQILNALKKEKPEPVSLGKEILTISEAADFLGVNRTTLWKWEKEGQIKTYGINGRKYFKRAEIINALIPITQ